MKRIIFPFLGMFMLMLSSCLKKGDNFQSFGEEPAIVEFSLDLFQPVLSSRWGILVAPELQDKFYTELYEGDVLWTWFTINYDQQPSTEYTVASNVSYFKFEKGWSQATTNGESTTGDFDLPIEDMGVYNLFKNVMFLEFIHKAPKDQKFTYEMTYHPEKTGEISVVYIRAKKVGQSSENETTVGYLYTFNMYSFFMQHKTSDNMVKFMIKFKTGEDDEGNDQYRDYVDNGRTVFEFPVE